MGFLCLVMMMFVVKTNAQTNFNITQPKGFTKVVETSGDLDNDGINELVLVYNTNEKKDRIGYNRELHIYKITNGIANSGNETQLYFGIAMIAAFVRITVSIYL